ncbi:helix-turn-helix domain-containing protein [Agromyces aureus]|uniref:HTH cro/C1-type domain-containing protein n=1 Tax=Agromyces aureus TaxID=453304 RepID=A0A191WF24_9MICO|nr:helix-turn-helix transcriptional regulator [Agromyces aureus]ANJ26779.1 hypothetical protein ATC03_08700 [Agromyces aureus]
MSQEVSARAKAYAKQLQADIKANRWTQQNVAAEVGIDVSNLSKKLNGKTPLGLDEMFEILDVIGVDHADYLTRAAALAAKAARKA